MKLMFADDTYAFPSHKNIDAVFDSMNVELGLSGLSLGMLIKLNVCYFILSQKGIYFHRLCLTFLLKIFISKGNIYQNF